MFSFFSQIERPFVVNQLQHDHRFAVTTAGPKRRRDGESLGGGGQGYLGDRNIGAETGYTNHHKKKALTS